MSPRVSMIASTYRSERFLPAWLESLAAQSIWPDVELVVVANDPQPEERALLDAFCAEHAQARVEEVPREPLYRSWNRAIGLTTAPVIAIANVDDVRTAAGLERQAEALEADPEALFAYGPYAVSTQFPPDPASARKVASVPFEREEFTRSMHLGPFFVWRRTADPGLLYFDEQLRVGGDMDLGIRLAIHGHGVLVDEPLGFYYDAGTGLSTGGDTQPIERTVLELRYGIYDKLESYWVPRAAEYVIPQLLFPGGEWKPVADVVPDYSEFLRGRRERWWPEPRRPLLQRVLAAVASAR